MIKKRLSEIFSYNGISLLIGVIGSLASISTIIITKWDAKVSVKWLVFVIFICIAIVLIMSKLLFDLYEDFKKKIPNNTTVIQYIPTYTSFVVKNNDFLGLSAMVSVFYRDGSFEAELGKGYVSNIQENFTQIQILEISDEFKVNYSKVLKKITSNDPLILQNIVIKSYLAYSI